jgi:hypothetical protein
VARDRLSLYDLSPGELELLWQAAQTADLIAALDEILWRSHATVTGATGQVKFTRWCRRSLTSAGCWTG